MDVSIIMINFNTPELTAQAIRAIRETTHKPTYEIIVVDNSSDERKRFAADGEVRQMAIENKGFSNACNAGAATATGRYVLFLNSDTMLHKGALDNCVSYMDAQERIGVLGIRTLLIDGTLDKGCKRGFPTPSAAFTYFLGLDKRYPNNPKFGKYHMSHLSEGDTNDVECVSGAFMMLPRPIFEAAGGFDERFFMYGEDVDLCYRLFQKGYRVVYFAGASMTHLKGGSFANTKNQKVIHAFYDSMRIFYGKHYRKKYNIFVTGAVLCAIQMKKSMHLLRQKLIWTKES